MSARIDIANVALTLIGQSPITSLEDDDPNALLIKTHYDLARDSTLEAYEWSFAIRRFIPPQLAQAPEWGWELAFAIPSDIMRVLTVEHPPTTVAVQTTSDMTRHQVDHVIEGREILTNRGPILCTGIRTISDEGIYSNLFATAFACRLAMMVCNAITESAKKFQEVSIMYAGAIKEASSRDGQQGTTRRLRNNSMRRAR